jgi:hypothetical protein
VDRLRYALIYPAAEPEPRGREDLEREVIMPEKTAFVLAPAIEALSQEERFNLLSPERFSTLLRDLPDPLRRAIRISQDPHPDDALEILLALRSGVA